jgi:hypothetical protein
MTLSSALGQTISKTFENSLVKKLVIRAKTQRGSIRNFEISKKSLTDKGILTKIFAVNLSRKGAVTFI